MSAPDPRHVLAAEAGAQAACAIAQLVNLPEPVGRPEVCALSQEELEAELAGASLYAVFADLDGPADGPAGLVLDAPTRGLLLEQLIGADQKPPFDEHSRSALCEVGNIAVSAAAGALGPLTDSVIVPSVPRLAPDLRAELADARGPVAYRVCTTLDAPQGPVRLTFFWLPREVAERGLS